MNKLVSLLMVALLLTGCATSWQGVAGKALVSTAQTVDSAMKGWAMYVVTANPPARQQDEVRAAYGQYQIAMDGALKAYNAAVTLQDQSVYVQASAALRTASQNIIALIGAYNPKHQ